MALKKPAGKPAKSTKSAKSENGAPAGAKAGAVSGWKGLTPALKGLWNKGREADPSSNFGVADIETGNYIARVHGVTSGKFDDGTPWFSITFVVAEGDYEGTQVRHQSRLGSEIGCEIAAKTLKVLAGHPDLGYEVSDMDVEDIPDFLAKVGELKPTCQIRVRNRTYTDKKGNEVEAQDVYLNKLVEQDD